MENKNEAPVLDPMVQDLLNRKYNAYKDGRNSLLVLCSGEDPMGLWVALEDALQDYEPADRKEFRSVLKLVALNWRLERLRRSQDRVYEWYGNHPDRLLEGRRLDRSMGKLEREIRTETTRLDQAQSDRFARKREAGKPLTLSVIVNLCTSVVRPLHPRNGFADEAILLQFIQVNHLLDYPLGKLRQIQAIPLDRIALPGDEKPTFDLPVYFSGNAHREPEKIQADLLDKLAATMDDPEAFLVEQAQKQASEEASPKEPSPPAG